MIPPLPPRWARRGLVHPLFWLLGAGVFVAVMPLALLALVVVFSGARGPLRLLRLLAFAFVYLGLELLIIPVALLTWLASGFGRALHQPWFVTFHYRLAAVGIGILFSVGSRTFVLSIDRQGPGRPGSDRAAPAGDPPLLVLSRHAGPGDSLALIHQLFSWAGRRPRIVLKHTLQWDPMIDLVFNRLPMAFVDPSSTRQRGAIAGIGQLAATMTPGDALLIFPEGRNVTPHRRRQTIARLRQAGREQAARQAESFVHLMLPRSRGMQAALAARPDLDVMVVAHTGLDDLSTVRDMWRAVPADKTLRLHWHRFPAAGVPKDPGGLSDWAFAQWQRMDAWIGTHRALAQAGPI